MNKPITKDWKGYIENVKKQAKQEKAKEIFDDFRPNFEINPDVKGD